MALAVIDSTFVDTPLRHFLPRIQYQLTLEDANTRKKGISFPGTYICLVLKKAFVFFKGKSGLNLLRNNPVKKLVFDRYISINKKVKKLQFRRCRAHLVNYCEEHTVTHLRSQIQIPVVFFIISFGWKSWKNVKLFYSVRLSFGPLLKPQ